MNDLPKFETNFPFKTLTPIVGGPTYETINHLTQEIYSNSSSITSTLGGGKHGNLWMVNEGSII